MVSCHLEEVGTNGMEAIMAGQSLISVKRL